MSNKGTKAPDKNTRRRHMTFCHIRFIPNNTRRTLGLVLVTRTSIELTDRHSAAVCQPGGQTCGPRGPRQSHHSERTTVWSCDDRPDSIWPPSWSSAPRAVTCKQTPSVRQLSGTQTGGGGGSSTQLICDPICWDDSTRTLWSMQTSVGTDNTPCRPT